MYDVHNAPLSQGQKLHLLFTNYGLTSTVRNSTTGDFSLIFSPCNRLNYEGGLSPL